MNVRIDFSKAADKQRLYSFLKAISGPQWVTVTPDRDNTTIYAYYRLRIVQAISDETGHDTDTVDKLIRNKFLGYDVPGPDGKVLRYYPDSVARLSPEEMGVFIEMVAAWMYDFFGIALPQGF